MTSCSKGGSSSQKCPLNLKQKHVFFDWPEKCQYVFEQLMECPVLGYPDFQLPLVLGKGLINGMVWHGVCGGGGGHSNAGVEVGYRYALHTRAAQ